MIDNLEVRAGSAGPRPVSSEIDAAQERLDLYPDRDQAAVAALTARLAQLAAVHPPAAVAVAGRLVDAVTVLTDGHAGCPRVGCTICLYLADAGAVAVAWQDRRY
jgi:hypothetical protein